MNEYQMYFAEEIAEDCGHGHISRTEALRRLRVLGVSAAVALSLLATACSGDGDKGTAQSVASNDPTNSAPATAPNDTAAIPNDTATPPPPAATPASTPAGTPNTEGNPNPTIAP